jgi:hypothetical protein
MKMRYEELIDTSDRNTGLRETKQRTASAIEEQHLTTGFDQSADLVSIQAHRRT